MMAREIKFFPRLRLNDRFGNSSSSETVANGFVPQPEVTRHG
jgi:hypothetical protein